MSMENFQSAQPAPAETHPLADKHALVVSELTILEEQLNNSVPDFKTQLHKIDQILRGYPEITYMLNDEQIGVIVRGLIKESDVQFFMANKDAGGAGKAGTKKASREKELKNLLGDLDLSEL